MKKTMDTTQREELVNLWEGGFDAETAADMVGVTHAEAISVFADLEVAGDDGNKVYFAAGARYNLDL